MNVVRQESDSLAGELSSGSISADFLVRSILRGKLQICLWVLVFVIGSVLFLNFATKRYEATLLFGSQIGRGSLLYKSDKDTLISLSNADPQVERFVAVLESMGVADELSHDPVIMETIFAKDWDSEKAVWREPDGFVNVIKHNVNYILGQPTWQAPDYVSLYSYIQSEVDIASGTVDNTYLIRYRDKDPEFASKFVSSLFFAADEIINKDDRKKIEDIRAFLENITLQSVSIEVKNSIFNILNRYLVFDAYSRAGGPYSVDLIDKARPNTRVSSPKPLWTLLGGAFLGLFVGLFHAIRRAIKQKNRP